MWVGVGVRGWGRGLGLGLRFGFGNPSGTVSRGYTVGHSFFFVRVV